MPNCIYPTPNKHGTVAETMQVVSSCKTKENHNKTEPKIYDNRTKCVYFWNEMAVARGRMHLFSYLIDDPENSRRDLSFARVKTRLGTTYKSIKHDFSPPAARYKADKPIQINKNMMCCRRGTNARRASICVNHLLYLVYFHFSYYLHFLYNVSILYIFITFMNIFIFIRFFGIC